MGSEKIVRSLDKSFRALVVGFEHDAQFALSNCDVSGLNLTKTLAQLTITPGAPPESLTYPHHRDWVEDDFNFDMSSYEDFDFGLWIYGLKTDPDLRQRLTQKWAGARHGGSIV